MSQDKLEQSNVDLIERAKEARQNAYAPYSQFRVGAALRTTDGRIFLGANVENASYGLTICAERSAIFAAVSAGIQSFDALAVVANTEAPVSPCGACRQVLAEFGKDWDIYLANLNGDWKHLIITDLLPGAFDGQSLKKIELDPK